MRSGKELAKLGQGGEKSWQKSAEVVKMLLVRDGSISFGGIETFCF